jgi:hypothetical protein
LRQASGNGRSEHENELTPTKRLDAMQHESSSKGDTVLGRAVEVETADVSSASWVER